MAQKNRYIGKSREWLETQLSKAQDDKAAGKTLTSWGQGGDSATKQVQSTPDERIDDLLYSLSILYPDTYEPTSTVGNNVTGLDFSGEGGLTE